MSEAIPERELENIQNYLDNPGPYNASSARSTEGRYARQLLQEVRRSHAEAAVLREERERHLQALELCQEAMQANGIDASDAIRELHRAGRV